jgi:hypothetical protein
MAALSIAAPPIAVTSIATTLGLGIVIYVVDAVAARHEQAEDSRSGPFPAMHLWRFSVLLSTGGELGAASLLTIVGAAISLIVYQQEFQMCKERPTLLNLFVSLL